MSALRAVVKVGGSLYDWPDLASRLREWLAVEWPDDDGVLLVPGGGSTADVVRQLDRHHRLGEETSHWLALRALALNAHFLAALLPSARAIDEVTECPQAWRERILPILNIYQFARADEERHGHLPHSWAAGSDALAARIAIVADANQLVLLKSTSIPAGVNWKEAGRMGLVDPLFAEVLRDAPADLQVRVVNLRRFPPSVP